MGEKMALNLHNREDVLALRREIFPYFMLNDGFGRMIDSLLSSSRHHRKEIDAVCHQLVKDFNINVDKEKRVTWEGWNAVFRQKLRKQGIDDNQSLLIHRYLEYDIQLSFNTVFLFTSGRYHLAMREMRFVLESFIHAFCIDKIYESLSLQEKLQELKTIEETKDRRFWDKKKLFTKTFTKNSTDKSLGREMYQLYQELCGKVHPSYDELTHLRKAIENHGEEFSLGGLYSFYNEENLIEALSIFSQLHTYLIKILECF